MSPARREPVVCGYCGLAKKCSRLILELPVCQPCMLRFARAAKACPGCGQVKVLAFYDEQRRPACAACTGNPAVYGCRACGREDSQWGRLCGSCALAERATTLLSRPGGGIHPQLQPVYDALLAGPRPQTTMYWFTRSTGPKLLEAMARGEAQISHATFEALPANKSNNYLRDLLTALGVLPPFHAELERVNPWLRDLLVGLPPEHADPIERFARWQVLRRLRIQEHHGTLTHGAISGARACLVAATRFLAWLERHGLDLTDLTQADLDRYIIEHPGRADAARPFILWAAQTGLTSKPSIPVRTAPHPHVTLSDEQRWAQVHTLLHEDSIRLYARIAGLFMLLYAQPLSRVVRMRAEQISTRHGKVTAAFDTFAIELPDPLDRLVTEHLSRRGQASYASYPDRWLFPGGLPGKHLVTENIRNELVNHGIQPLAARNAAMLGLAATMPTPILAEILGLAPNTAARWGALAARDWSKYTAQRRADLQR